MYEDDMEQLYKKALGKWKAGVQIQMTIEECAELIVALAKYGRNNNGSTIEEMVDELADVQIMINQMKLIFSGVEDKIQEKMHRLKKRLE